MLTKHDLIKALLKIGINKGMVLNVHTSLRKIGYVEGGPQAVIESLLEILGEEGTLVMPSMTSGEEIFDVKNTPTDGMGIVAETFWKMPGVLRSNHPNSSFAAYGKYAKEIVVEHPLADPEGIKSPIGKVFQHDGNILLLGVSHDSNTMIHLAESLNHVPYRTISHIPIMNHGQIEIVNVPFINHCCRNFKKMNSLLKSSNKISIQPVGAGIAQLMKAKDVIDIASEQLKKNIYYFLCEDDCEECSEAREYALANL